MFSRKKKRGESSLPCFLSGMRRSVSSATLKISQWLPSIKCAKPFSLFSRYRASRNKAAAQTMRNDNCSSYSISFNSSAATTGSIAIQRSESLSNTPMDDATTENITNASVDSGSVMLENSPISSTITEILTDDDNDFTSIIDGNNSRNFPDDILVIMKYQRGDDDSFMMHFNYWVNRPSLVDFPADSLSMSSLNTLDIAITNETCPMNNFSEENREDGRTTQHFMRPGSMTNNDLPRNLDSRENSALNDSTGPTCNVCKDTWSEIQHKKHLMYLDCYHVFCNVCVIEMIRRFQPCPMCRKKVTYVKKLHFF